MDLTVKVANREFVASGDAADVLRAYEMFTKGPREQSKEDVVRAIALVDHAIAAVAPAPVAAPTVPSDRPSGPSKFRTRAIQKDILAILADGEWHQTSTVQEIACGRFNVGRATTARCVRQLKHDHRVEQDKPSGPALKIRLIKAGRSVNGFDRHIPQEVTP